VTDPSESQLRLVYSLLKPMVRIAARFGVPVRTLGELLKLAYFEHLRREQGLPHAAVAARMGQTERSMRSLEQRLRSDFFAAESEVGLLRSIEDALATEPRTPQALTSALSSWDGLQIQTAIQQLLDEQRIKREPGGVLGVSHRYMTLTSDAFHQRIDALNHHLDTLYQAVVQRLLLNRRRRTMIKTISFDASAAALEAFAERLAESLREDIGRLEASEHDGPVERYSLGVTLAARADDPAGDD